MQSEFSGQCLCGAVSFEAKGRISRISACYCDQCRTQNGGGPFYGVELKGELVVKDETALTWYASSDKAERAFCATCGSSLFWRANKDPSYFDVSIGVVEGGADLKLDAHIFVDHCPDYMSVQDNAPHFTGADVLSNPSDDQC